MKNVVVSVIVPVYNVEQYLCECIDSVLAQSLGDLEVLLVDDGSTDRSGEICDEYVARDCRVKVFHKKNGGLSSARNVGIEMATGKYIIFIDSDDYWLEKDCLMKLIDTAECFKADIVRGEYREVDEFGQHIFLKDFSKKYDKKMQVLSSAEFYKYIINGENFSVLLLFKSSIFLQNFRFDEKRCFEEDVDFNIRLFCNEYRCVYMPLIFYAYRKRRNSIVNSYNIAHLKDSFLLSDIFDQYSDIVKNILLRDVYRENAVLMYYYTLITIAEDPYYKERHKIIESLNLTERRKKVLALAHKYGIIRKSYIFNLLSPNLSIILYRFRIKLKCKRL